MLDGYYSKRYKLRPQSCGFIYEFVPESARSGLYQILNNYFQDGSLNANQLYFNVNHALHIPQVTTYGRAINLIGDTRKSIEKLIMECEWWQFYDICEVIPRSLNPCFDNMVKKDFYEKANILFKNEKLGFEITDDGTVREVDTSFTDATIKKARYLLKDSGFKEAGEFFEQSLQEIYYKTQPDCEKCINDALSAMEAVARVINNSNNKPSSFNEIIDNLTENGMIPRQIDRVIRNIYISIGDHQRRIYGMYGLTEIGIDEAEFVMATIAAIITYLVSKSRQSEKATVLNDQQTFIEDQTTIRS